MNHAAQRRTLRVPAFVGRQDGLAVLDASLDRASRFAAPQVVTVVGALGSGKTRLLQHWSDQLASNENARVVRATGRRKDAQGTPERHALISAILRQRFALTDDLSAAASIARFSSQLQAVFGDRRVAEVAALLGRFIGINLPETPVGRALASRPDREAEVAGAILCRFFEEDCKSMPLVLVVDDLHLADEASIDLLATLASEIGEGAIMLVASARSELYVRRPSWGRAAGNHSRVDLGPLSPLEMDIFMRSVLDTELLATGLALRAACESGGNPHLLRELVGAYQQHGILVAETGSTWRFDAARAAGATIALSPGASAQLRVADLSPAERELLARAAAFGPDFWTGGLVALGRLGASPPDAAVVFAPDPGIDEVRRILDRLAAREYITQTQTSRVVGDTEWSFCDAKERSLVSAGIEPELLRVRKRFAGQWLQSRVGNRHELIAALYQEGGDNRRAAQCFLAAGADARKHLRHDRARAFYLQGVALLDVEDALAKVDAYHCLGDLAMRTGRVTEAIAHFREMLVFAWHLDLPGKGGAAHARLGRILRGLGDYATAAQHLDLAHILFDLAGDRPGIAATLDDIGRLHFLTGRAAAATAFHRGALTIREALGDDRGKGMTLSWMGLVEQRAGNLAAAAEHYRIALGLARQSRDPHGIVFSLLDLGALAREAGQVDDALATLEEARKLSRDMGETFYECHLGIEIAECLVRAGRQGDATREISAARALANRFGARRLLGETHRVAAEASLAAGDVLGARDQAERALGIAESIGAPALRGAALRLLGISVASGAPANAENGGAREIFDRALEVLEGAGAELELGRALAAYADFEQAVGRDENAEQMRGHARDIWRAAWAPLSVAPQDIAASNVTRVVALPI